jgi:hypothetical protein
MNRNGTAMNSSHLPRAPAVGQLLRTTRLGSDSVYRVSGFEGALVVLEVVDAPGLVSGSRFRFTGEAVAAMQAVSPHAADASSGT